MAKWGWTIACGGTPTWISSGITPGPISSMRTHATRRAPPVRVFRLHKSDRITREGGGAESRPFETDFDAARTRPDYAHGNLSRFTIDGGEDSRRPQAGSGEGRSSRFMRLGVVMC